MKRAVLPVYYYLEHFMEMLSFVETTYRAILGTEHYRFIEEFRTLSKDEQCIFVRIGQPAKQDLRPLILRYAEIAHIEHVLQALTERGFLRRLHAEDYGAWLSVLRKDQLIAIARAAQNAEARASWSKPKLIEHFVERLDFDIALRHGEAGHYVVLADTKPVEFLLYLYFGKTREDLKSFALRDLGIVR